jgi:hypothetical protein
MLSDAALSLNAVIGRLPTIASETAPLTAIEATLSSPPESVSPLDPATVKAVAPWAEIAAVENCAPAVTLIVLYALFSS